MEFTVDSSSVWICYLILSGVHFDVVLFVPNQSQYNKLGSNTSAPAEPEEIDLSWQLSLQTVWEKLLQDKGAFEIQNRLL